MSWQALILLNALIIGTSLIVTRVLAHAPATRDAPFVIGACQSAGIWIIGLFLLPHFGHVDGSVMRDYWVRLVGGGLAFAVSGACTYKSLTYLDAAVGSIFNTLNALCTVGLAALLLREDLTVMQLIGGAMLLGSVVYTTLAIRAHKNKTSARNLLLGLGFAVMASLVYATAIVNEKWLLGHMSVGSYLMYGWGWQLAAVLAIAITLQGRKFRVLLQRRTARFAIVVGLLRGVGAITFVLAQVRSNNVALITVIANSKMIVVMLLGAWLLHERRYLTQKAIGTVGALVGLAVMLWK